MGKILKLGKFNSEDITDKTYLLIPFNGEELEDFFKRATDSMEIAPKVYGRRFVALVDGILIDFEKFHNNVIESNGNPVEAFNRIKNEKKSVDEKFGLDTKFQYDDRRMTMLELASSGLIITHHTEVTDFAKEHRDKHFLMTASNFGIFDADQLMKLPANQIKEYIREVSDRTDSIMAEYKRMQRFDSAVQELLDIMRYATEPQKKEMLEKLSEITAGEKSKLITPEEAAKSALSKMTVDKIREAEFVEREAKNPDQMREGETKDD